MEIGCDHGHIARALDAIGTERRPHRLPRRRDIRLVVADGLLPFRDVAVAVISGIGAWQISRILQAGPLPATAVLHAPDRPGWLRCWCAEHGWRIEAERLVPEARGFAEVFRVARGQEPHRGLLLEFGPLLLNDPLLPAHAAYQCAHWQRILHQTSERAPDRAAHAARWVGFLEPLARGERTPGPA